MLHLGSQGLYMVTFLLPCPTELSNMARRTTGPSTPQLARLTLQEMQSGIDRLRKRIEEVRQFNPESVTDQHNIPQIKALSASIDDTLVRTFGADTIEYKRYRIASQFNNGPFNYAYPVPIHQVQQSLRRSQERNIALLEQAAQSLEEQISEETDIAAPMATKIASTLDISKIFIVHGREEGPR